MRDMAYPSTTKGKLAVPHGMRSCFRDWVSEETGYANHVAEAALWHSVADKVEAAYRRGDLFQKRRLMMNEWSRYCSMPKHDASVDDLDAHRRKRRAARK
jgi:hypothetical protein